MKKVYNVLTRYYIFAIVILLMGSATGAFAQPTANAGPDKTICENKTLTLSGASASGYDGLLWGTSGNGTFSPSNSDLNPVYTPGNLDTSPVTLTLTASASGFSDAVGDMILILSELPVPYAGVDATVCNGNNYQIVGASITGGAYGYMAWNGGWDGVFVNPTDLNPEYQPGQNDLINGQVTLNLVVNPSSPCSTPQYDSFVLTFSDEISADAGADGTICEDGTFSVSGTTVNANTYTWSTVGGDGTFDDENALSTFYTPGSDDITAGGVTIVLTADNLYCDPAPDDLYLTINPLPGIVCPVDFAVCVSGGPVTLTDGSPAGGQFSGTGVSGGEFDPSVGVGSYDITYSYTDPSTGCSDDCTFEITVNELPDVQCPTDFSVCKDESAFALSGATPTGGTYSGTGVTAGNFDPSVGVGTYTIKYVYTDPGTSCTDSCDFEITVAPTPIVSAGVDQTVCEGVVVQLDASAQNYSDVLWITFFGDGDFDPFFANTLDPTYTPGFSDYIVDSVVLHAIFAPASPCQNSIMDTVVIYFINPPVADAGAGGTICEDGSFNLNGSVENACGSLWISDDASGVFVDATTPVTSYTPGTDDIAAGFATLTLIANPCSPCAANDSSDVVIIIQKNPTVDILFEKDTVCENAQYDFAGKVSYSDSSAVIWFTGNGSNSWDNINAGEPVYTVSQLDALQGVINIIVTVSPINPCSVEAADSCKLYIQPLPDVQAGADKTVCEDASISLSDASVDFSDDVLWTDVLAGDGTFDDATEVNATFTPGPNAIGLMPVPYTQLRLTAQPIDPCTTEEWDEVTIYIQLLPVVTAGDNDTICEGDTYQVNGSVSGACGSPSFVWTSSGTGGFDDDNSLTAIYTPSLDDIDDKSVYLILTGEPCPPCLTRPADSLLLTIQHLPDVDAGPDQTVCEDETVYLDGDISNQCLMQWSTFGNGNFNFTDIANPEYTFGLSDIQNGEVKLMLAGGFCPPCVVGTFDTVTIYVQLAPVADAGVGGTICEDASYVLEGDVENASGQLWSVVSGGGSFNDSTLLLAEYTPGADAILAGFAELKLKALPIGPCSNADSSNVILTIKHNPTVDILFDTDTVCENAQYDFAGKVSYTDKSAVIWYTSNGSNSWSDINADEPVYTVSQSDAWQGVIDIIVTVSPLNPCTVESIDSCKLYIQPLPVVDAGVGKTVCENASIPLSDASVLFSNNVVWTDIIAGDGIFADSSDVNTTFTPGPNAVSNGYTQLQLTAESIEPCITEKSALVMINVRKLPVVAAGDDDTICEDVTSYPLTGTVSEVCGPTFLEWTTSGTGDFDDENSSTTNYNPTQADIDDGYVYLIITGNPCTPCVDAQSDSLKLTFQLLPDVDAGADADVCESGFFLLEAEAYNYDGVLWTTGGDGTFDLATDLNPTYYPGTTDAALGTVELVVEVTAIAPCAQSDKDTIVLNVTPLPIADAGADDTACETGYTFQNGSVFAANYSNIEWTSNGTGTFDGATDLLTTYNPSDGDVAAGMVTLSLVANPIHPCVTSDQDDMNLFIIESAEVYAGADFTICDTETYTLSGATVSHQQTLEWSSDGTGTFSPDEFTLGATYNPSAADILDGEIELCLSATSVLPCTATPQKCMTLTIQSSPVANAGLDGTLCETGGDVTGLAENEESVEWLTEGTGTFANETSLTATYFPSAADITAGSVNLVFVVEAKLPCTVSDSDTANFVIQLLPAANAGSDKTICGNGYAHTLNGSVTNACGSLWVSTTGGTFNDASLVAAAYTPSQADLNTGSVSLSLTATACAPCTGQDSTDVMTIYFSPAPEAYAGIDGTFCEDAILLNDATVANNASILWTTTGTGTFSPNKFSQNPQYIPSTYDNNLGQVTLTISATPILPCDVSAKDDIVINIEPNPIVQALDDETICEGESYTIPGGPVPLAQHYSTIEWTSTGSGTFTPDEFAMNPTYEPSSADIDAGSVDLCINVNPIDACTLVLDTCMTLTIQKLPTVFAGDDATSCGLSAYPLTDATASDFEPGTILWTKSGDGTFDDPGVLNTTYNPGANDLVSSSVTLYVQVSPISPCVGAPARDTIIIIIQPKPVANAGADGTICEDESYELVNASVQFADGQYWAGGDGVFSLADSSSLHATYTPGTTDIDNGSVDLYLIAKAKSPCVLPSAADTMTLTIYSLPEVEAGPNATICENGSYYLSDASADDFSSVTWTGGTGSFTNINTVNATYNTGIGETGDVILTLAALPNSPCTSSVSDSMTLTINALPEFVSIDLQASVAALPVDYSSLPGDLGLGYGMCLDGSDATHYWLDVDDLVATHALAPGEMNAFYHTATVPADFLVPYWSSRGVVSGASGWQGAMWEIINGNQPIFYLVYDGTDYALIDGLQYQNVPSDSVPLVIPGDYPQGLYNFAGTFKDVNGCTSEEATFGITFGHAPIANAGDDATICEDGSYQLSTSAVSNASGQFWTGGLGFNDATLLHPTYSPTQGDIDAVSVVLCMTAEPTTPCEVNSAEDCMTLTIQKLPTVFAGDDDTSCGLSAYPLATATAYDFEPGTLLWTKSGDGTFDDPGVLNTTYNPGSNDLSSSSVTLYVQVSPISPCVGAPVEDTIVLFIQPKPVANAGADGTICEDESYELVSSSVQFAGGQYWAGGDGEFSLADSLSLHATYTPGDQDILDGSVKLYLTAKAKSPCLLPSAPDSMTLTIYSLPVVEAGSNATICENGSYTFIDATVSGASSFAWSGGAGTFDNGSTLGATYNAASGETGDVTLTLTAQPNSPCTSSVSDSMILTINPLPEFVSIELQTSVAPTTAYVALPGDLGLGYGMCLDGTDVTHYWLDVATLTATYDLEPGEMNAFYHTATIPADFLVPYWSDRGVVLGASGWQGVMWEIINGNQPVFYLVYDGTDYALIDGLQYQYASLEVPLTIPGDYPQGLYNFSGTFKDVNGCVSEEAIVGITFGHAPLANAGDDATVCENGSYQLTTATVTNATGQFWTGGDGEFTLADSSSLNATYTPAGNDFIAGSVELCLTAEPTTPCVVNSDADCMTLTIQKLPTVFAGDDATSCALSPFPLTDATASNFEPGTILWTKSGDGNFDDPGVLNTTYNPGPNDLSSSSVTLYVQVSPISPCAGGPVEDTIVIFIQKEVAVIFANEDGQFYQNANLEYCYDEDITITLDSIVDGVAPFSFGWDVLDGGTIIDSGTADNMELNDTLFSQTYTPGTYTVELTSMSDANGCSPSDISIYTMNLVVNPEPTLEVTLDTFAPQAVNEYCYDDSFDICLTGVNGTSDWTVEWAVTGPSGPFTDIMTGTSECFPFDAIDFLPGTYTLTIESLTDSKGCEASQITLDSYGFQIVINPEPTLTVTLDGSTPAASKDYCYDDSFEICLTGDEGTGDWTVEWAVTGPSGPFTDIMTGTSECFPFDAIDFLPGTYELTIVSLTDAKGCAATQTTLDSYGFQIVINPEPTLAVTLDTFTPLAVNEYCYNDSFDICLTGVNGTGDWTVEWAVTGPSGPFADTMTGTSECFPFDAIDFLPGTYTLTIESLTDAKGCEASQTTLDSYGFQIVINPEPTLAVTLDTFTPLAVNEYCYNDSFDICLTGVNGTGDWTVEWAVTGPSGPFGDVMTGASECFPFDAIDFLPGTYELTIVSLTDAKGCAATQTTLDSYGFQIVINPEPTLEVTLGGGIVPQAVNEYCFDDNFEICLTGVNGTPNWTVEWAVSGPSGSFADVMTGTGDCFPFNAIDFLPGTYDLTVESLTDAKGCEASQTTLDSYAFQIVILPQPNPHFTIEGDPLEVEGSYEYCYGVTEAMLALVETQGGNTTVGDAPFDISFTVNGGTAFDFTDVEFDDEINLLTYTTNAPGFYAIQVTSVVDSNGCAIPQWVLDTWYKFDITIHPEPALVFANNGVQFYEDAILDYCEGERIVITLDAAPSGLAPFDIAWELDGDPASLSGVNVGDTLFDGTKGAGTYPIVITSIVDDNDCSPLDIAPYNATLEVGPPPALIFASNGEQFYEAAELKYCEGTTIVLTLDEVVLGVAPFNVSWTVNSAPFSASGLDEGSELFNGVQPVGSYDLAITSIVDVNGCSPLDYSAYNANIEVIAAPAVYAGINATICEGEDFPLDLATVVGSDSFSWSTDGDGEFSPSPFNVVQPTYVPDTLDFGKTITLYLIAQANSPCTGIDNSFITLYIQPKVTAYAGEDASVCEDGMFPLGDATVEFESSFEWSTTGSGTFDDKFAVNPTYDPTLDLGTTVTLCLTAQPIGQCDVQAQSCIDLFVQPKPTAFAGDDATIQSNETYLLDEAVATNYGGLLWETSGDGTFDGGVGILQPTYIPGGQDIIDGEALLTLTALGTGPCADSVHNFLLTILGIPPTVEIISPLDNTFFDYSPVLVEGTADDADGTIAFVEVRVNGGAWQTAIGAEVWSIEVQLDPCLNNIEARATDSQGLQSELDMVSNIKLNGQSLVLKQGWSYISSYIEAADPSFFTLEDYILPINNVVIMLNDEGSVFWPSESINTLGSWNNQDGYKVKSNVDGSWLLAGDNTANQTINLKVGANIFPVLSNVDYALPGAFVDDNILIIFELQTARIYWPDGGLYTLTELKPGFGYLGNFYNPFSITYDDYVDCTLKSDASEVEYLTNESPWQLDRTASVHLISVPGDAVAELDKPEFIGAFDANGMCIGYADVREKADNYLLVIYGDEQSTGEKDGAQVGEAINLVTYNNGVEEAIVAIYDMAMPNFDGNYTSNGLSKIASFKASTGVGTNVDISELIRVFPNPASGKVTIFYPIDGSNTSVKVTFTNASGSAVMNEVISSEKAEIDISNLQSGVYFVKFENKGSVSVKRLVVK